MIKFDNSIPIRISEFDLITFINRKTQLLWLYQSMEIQRDEYLVKNPTADITELNRKIDIIKDHLTFLQRLQSEYEVVCRVNMDYINVNILLATKNAKLKNEILLLKVEIDTLKKNIESQLLGNA